MAPIGDRIHELNRVTGLFSASIETYYVIIGSMKSGTTTLYNYLMQHPQIARNRWMKEPGFFSSDDEWRKGMGYYSRQYFPTRSRTVGALDGSTNYAKYPSFPNVPERMSRCGANFKFIYMMRNPLDRIESQMAHSATHEGKTYGPDLTLDDIEHELDVSRYATQLDRYHEAFDDPQIHLVRFEEFKSDPVAVVQDAFRFLDVDPGFEIAVRAPDNVRRKDGSASSVRLPDELKPAILDELAPELFRLQSFYDFPIAPWDLGLEFENVGGDDDRRYA